MAMMNFFMKKESHFKYIAALSLFLLLGFTPFLLSASTQDQPLENSMPHPQSLYDFTMKTIDGKDQSLGDFKGKALLIVNVASRCGFTKQYEGLQALYEKYHARGFEILGFPANNFMGQEPGTDAEIKQFCSLKYHVTFPMFSKISVKGKDIHPLYQFLTGEPSVKGDISWNFNKFLIDPKGQIVARFDSKKDPLSEDVVKALELVLPS